MRVHLRCTEPGCTATTTADVSMTFPPTIHGASGWGWDSIHGWRCPEHPSPLCAPTTEVQTQEQDDG